MALHLTVLLDLEHGGVLLVPQGNDFIKGKNEVEGTQGHGLLLQQALAELRHQLGHEAQRLQVLQDVALLVGHQQHVQTLHDEQKESSQFVSSHRCAPLISTLQTKIITDLHGLVHIADVLRLHVRMLLARAHQLGEGSQETLDADSAHVHILPAHKGCRGGQGKAQRGEGGVCMCQGTLLKGGKTWFALHPYSRLPLLDNTEAASTTIELCQG
jgi:hypothetical protein